MKLAYYLRGLGTGVAITALLLGMYYGFGDKSELTDLQIMKKAEDLGMVKKEDTLNLDSLTPETSEKPVTSPAVSETSQPDATKKPAESSKPEPAATPEAKQESSDGTSHKLENAVHKIYLPQGLDSKDIAADLESWGVIDNAKEFDRYLTAGGHDRKISFGSFTIPSGASYADIAKTLTRPDR